MSRSIFETIAKEIGVRQQQVEAAVALLDGGATVPFVARYRKEATGALDDAQLRTLEERLTYLRELETRREAILSSIREQGKLDAAEANYRLLVEAQPSAGAHLKLSQALIRVGRLEEAEKEMARARAMGAK